MNHNTASLACNIITIFYHLQIITVKEIQYGEIVLKCLMDLCSMRRLRNAKNFQGLDVGEHQMVFLQRRNVKILVVNRMKF